MNIPRLLLCLSAQTLVQGMLLAPAAALPDRGLPPEVQERLRVVRANQAKTRLKGRMREPMAVMPTHQGRVTTLAPVHEQPRKSVRVRGGSSSTMGRIRVMMGI